MPASLLKQYNIPYKLGKVPFSFKFVIPFHKYLKKKIIHIYLGIPFFHYYNKFDFFLMCRY